MAQLELAAPVVARLPSALHRQQLVRLSAAGWTRVLEAAWDADARACLELWAGRGLPLVVTRQPPAQDDALATGLPAPSRFWRRRLAVQVAPRDILFLDEFPPAAAVTRLLPRAAAMPWRALLAMLAAADCAPRVYGGYGWQALTRLAYVHAASDIDLLLPVDSAAQADAVARVLALQRGSDLAFCPPSSEAGGTHASPEGRRQGLTPWNGPRLDGELLFPDGAAIAWREWLAHREGRAAQVLVKRLHSVALETPAAGLA